MVLFRAQFEDVIMKQLQGLDAAFVALEQPNSPMHIGSILIYDPSTAPGGFVRFKDILSFIDSRLMLSDTMRQSMAQVPFNLDFPFWFNDKDFDLEYHIRHVALPSPGDWRQLCIQAARLFSRPLDLSKPPWEFTVIEGLDNVDGVPKGSYALVTKIHHSAIDGMSGIDVLNATHTLDPNEPAPEGVDEFKPEARPNQFGLFVRGYFGGLLNPLRQLDVARKSVPGMARAAQGLINRDFDLEAIWNTPSTRFNKRVSPHRVIDAVSFDIGDVKAMRGLSEGSKVNDVMLAIIGGGLRKYLEAKKELPETSLTAMAPISVRDESEQNTMGNQVAAMFVPLGSHIADPLERLKAVHQETVKSKAMSSALGARQMTEVSKTMPALYTGVAARLYSQLGIANMVKPIFNTVVTNVPGPPIPIYSTGAELKKMFGLLCLFDGVGLGNVVQSYRDEINVSFTACRECMPDPGFYADCLKESYGEYADLLKSKSAVAKKAQNAKRTRSVSKADGAGANGAVNGQAANLKKHNDQPRA
jgi:WS/DGAT/MGAT family acyltransferase